MNKDEWLSAAHFSARKMLRRWKDKRPFVAEVLLAAVEMDIGPANERRWFGATILALKADKLIAPAGYAAAKSSHGSPKHRWRIVNKSTLIR